MKKRLSIWKIFEIFGILAIVLAGFMSVPPSVGESEEILLADSTDESATQISNKSTYSEDPVTASFGGLATSNTASWTTGGPYGGYVNSLAIFGTNPDIIYAGTESGLFKTINGGLTWTRTSFPEMRVRIVQVAPDNPDIVYVGTDDGIYKSEAGGGTWTRKGLTGARVNAIAIDPLNPHTIYAGTGWPLWYKTGEIVGVFKSTDKGETWQRKLSSGLDAVAALLIDTDDSSYIYAGVYTQAGGRGLRKSTDGGETWVRIKVGRYNWDAVVALAMTPPGSSPAVIYAVNEDSDVFKSTDRGDNWTPTNTPWIAPASPWALTVDQNNPNVIYVGTHYKKGRFYKSTDGGDTWSIKANSLPPACPSSIVIDPRNSAVYVGLSSGGVYKSADGAESWNISSQGINNTFIEDLAIHPTSLDTVFSAIKGEGQYLAKTTNGGTSWDYLVGSPSDLGAVAFDPQNPSTIWVGRDLHYDSSFYIHKSTDGGQSWGDRWFLHVSGGRVRLGVSDIWVSPSNSRRILVAVAGLTETTPSAQGVYLSTNGGETWQQTHNLWATTLAADPSNPNLIYLGTARNGYVFQSTDGGRSWTIISPGGEWVGEVRDIEVDLISQVFVATDSGLWKWNGSDWIKFAGPHSDNITALAIDRSTSPGTLYVGTGEDGVLVSCDGGGTWIPFNEGLGSLFITKLAIRASPKCFMPEQNTVAYGVDPHKISQSPLGAMTLEM